MKRLNKILESQAEILASYGKNFRARHTLAELEAIYASHAGRCDICGHEPGKRKLVLDHCHETGKLRGLLCGNCNKGLGFFKDNASVLELAIRYLKHHS